MHSREEVTQGEPLDMVTYVIGFLPIFKCLKAAHLDVSQLWYAKYSSELVMFNNIVLCFNLLKRFGPGCAYYPEPSK